MSNTAQRMEDEDMYQKSSEQLGRKFDGEKPDWSLLDLNILEDMVKVLTFGAKKYERDNWKYVDQGEDRYYAAMMRHMIAHRSGEKLDPESGLPHLAHGMCCLTFLSWLNQNEKEEGIKTLKQALKDSKGSTGSIPSESGPGEE